MPICFLHSKSTQGRKCLNQLFKWSISPSTDIKLFLVAKSSLLPVCKILYYLLIYKNSNKKMLMLSLFVSLTTAAKTKKSFPPQSVLTSFSNYSRGRGNRFRPRSRSTGFLLLPLASSATLTKTYPHVSFSSRLIISENLTFLTVK